MMATRPKSALTLENNHPKDDSFVRGPPPAGIISSRSKINLRRTLLWKRHESFLKSVHGEVESNDGEFAEIQTVGIEGIETDLLLETIQVHRSDTSYSCEQFQDKFPVGSWLYSVPWHSQRP